MNSPAFAPFVAAIATVSWLYLPACAFGQGVRVVDTGMPWNVTWGRLDDDDELSWALSDLVDSRLQIGGWTSAGYTANAHGNHTGNGNAPLSLNNVADTPVLNQLWLYAEKPMDTESKCVDWGFRFDYVFGADAPDFQAAGDQAWDYGWNTSRDYGSAIPQLYAELGIHDLIFRTGYGIGLQGFEAGEAVDNFLYSHNYAFGYGVPGTFSGAVIEYDISEELNVIGGWTTGWDSWWSNYLSASTFMGGLAWFPADEISVTYHVTVGDFGDGTAKNGASSNAGTIYAHAIVFTYTVSEQTEYVLEHTLGSNTGLGTGNNQWYSLTNYLFYDIDDHWAVGGRIEWFRDEDGARVDVNGAGPGSFYEATLGLNWKPHSNIRFRPEVRWDWFTGPGHPFDSRDGGSTGTETSQFTVGMDVVASF